MILVYGMGKSGKAASKFLTHLGVDHLTYDGLCPSLEGISQIVLSPGIDPRLKVLEEARQKGIEIIGEVELGLRHVGQKLIGVTGTNGKTTTCLLIKHFLDQNQTSCALAGNIGKPLCEYLLNPKDEWLILELSSYQLETVRQKNFDYSVILNIHPHHLTRYESFDQYAKAKLRLTECTKNTVFAPRELIDTYSLHAEDFTSESPENLNISKACYMAAKRVAHQLGAKRFSLQNFQKAPHRLQFLGEKKGLRFFNDSKSTNPHSTLHALTRVKGPVLLLCGGVDANQNFEILCKEASSGVKKVLAFGKSAQKIKNQLHSKIETIVVNDLTCAFKTALKIAQPNDAVLLSPGCQSFDQFENFEKRGEAFIRLVEEAL